MEKKISVTGIKPTGVPHLGNYFGAIVPALRLASEYNAFYFIADYHALNSIKDKKTMQDYCYQVAATWLACGLNPEEVVFYRQSQVPETIELHTVLNCFTPKGLMNRAHAYKAIIQKNKELGKDTDDGVNMGIFTYPVLMAADILQFQADVVPVGKDNFQHIEMAVDIAQAINHNYQKDLFKIPKAIARENTQLISGLDGRKMSKSYQNTIQLFMPENQLKKTVMRIVTNCQSVEECKNPDNCNIFAIYKLFASDAEIAELTGRYKAGGMGWGDAKMALFTAMNNHIKPMRDKYDEIIKDKKQIDKVLAEGAEKARYFANKTLKKVKKTVGF